MNALSVASRVENLVGEALRRAGCSGVSTRMVVGASGGPDSCALLLALHRLREAHGLELHVAHLNHDFRGEEAEEDARFVAQLARGLGLPVTVEKQDPQEYQRERRISSFEQAAREMRYRFLADVARGVGAAVVAVGHTADDLAETVLEHILRGSGLSGLRGMTEVSPWPWPTDVADVTLFRPLLRATKEETAAYCRELGRGYREDSGNRLPRFTRNRVRHELLPLLEGQYNPRIREALVRLARSAALDLDYLDREADRAWPQVVIAHSDTGLEFQRQALASLHPALLRRVLRQGYARVAGDTRRLRESHLSAMTAVVQDRGAGRALALPGGLYFHEAHDRLVISRDRRPDCPLPSLGVEYWLDLSGWQGGTLLAECGGWRITAAAAIMPGAPDTAGGTEAFTARFDPGALEPTVQVRARRPGDRFQPLGMLGEKKLQDFFTDAHVPRAWRDRVPLLVSGGRIAWVVGYRVAQWAGVQSEHPAESPALQVTFERLATEA